jgi:hypothetical protein
MSNSTKTSILYGSFLLFFVSGCSLFQEDVCTSVSVPAFFIQVESADPEQPLQSYFAVAEDGTYRDSVFVTDFVKSPTGLAADRAGTYSIRAGSDGFTTQQFQNISVPSDGCHPETIKLEVVLEPIK